MHCLVMSSQSNTHSGDYGRIETLNLSDIVHRLTQKYCEFASRFCGMRSAGKSEAAAADLAVGGNIKNAK